MITAHIDTILQIMCVFVRAGFHAVLLSVLPSVEQEQIQKRTFTNWINAQLSKVRVRVQELLILT